MTEHVWKTWKAWVAKHKFRVVAAIVGSLMVLLALITGQHVSRKSTIARIKRRKEAQGLQAELQYLDEVAQSAKKQADAADAQLERRKAELDREIKKWDAERIAKEFRERGY